MSRKSGPAGVFAVLIFGVIFAVAGFFIMKYGQKMVDRAKASLDWPSVQGKIVESEVNRERKQTGTGSDKKIETMYTAEIIYSYQVGAQEYESTQRRIGGKTSSSNSSDAYKIVGKYPKGKSVAVYYDPVSPEEAVLEPGVFLETKVVWYMGGVFFIIGILIAGGIVAKILLISFFLIAKK